MENTITLKNKRLYYRGNPSILEGRSIAVIGTRHPTDMSRKVGYRLTKKICELADLPIITGLAIGCDTIAARAALDAGKPVIAVLPSSTSEVYPRSNRGLAEEIISKGGCLVSEYPPGTAVQKWRFIERDKLIAEISDAIIAVECKEVSGTMHTIKAAYSLSKKMGCWLPADATLEDFGGNYKMISEYSASEICHTSGLMDFLNSIK